MDKIEVKTRAELEQSRRNTLRVEKPLAFEKIMCYAEKEKKGEPVPVIDFAYDYACNMHCLHCSNACFTKKERCLSLSDVENLSLQADQLGLAQFSLSGGEPTVFPNLDSIIEAIQPSKFHIALNTNGLLVTKELAIHLKEIGLDKVKISLDSFDEHIYNQTRQQKGAYDKALYAIKVCSEASLQVSIQTVVSHQTCRSKGTEELAKFAHNHHVSFDLISAKAIGRWEGKEDVLLTPEDDEFLLQLRNLYPEVHRDIYPAYGKCGGCIALKHVIHVTKYGDVLPCPFMHISIGNIFEESLKDILDRGMRIKWFHAYHPICLAGEDRGFIRNYMSKFYGKPLPVDWKEVFTNDDFIDGIAK